MFIGTLFTERLYNHQTKEWGAFDFPLETPDEVLLSHGHNAREYLRTTIAFWLAHCASQTQTSPAVWSFHASPELQKTYHFPATLIFGTKVH